MSQHPLMTAHDALLQAIEAYNAETNDYNEVVEEIGRASCRERVCTVV